jgi:hypothetical protein
MDLTKSKQINVYFNNFWPGFLEGKNPNTVLFFIELFKKVFNTEVIIVNNYLNANILCECAPCSLDRSLLYRKKWDYSFLATGESIMRTSGKLEHYKDFSCFLSGLRPESNLNQVIFPLFKSYLFCNSNKWKEPVNKVPSNMVCAIIGNPNGIVRNKFLDVLEKKISVKYGGSFRNNIGYKVGGDHNSEELINFIRQHKFVVTMENYEEDYYITEKICNGLFAGVIPIYWGSPNITEYFNEDRFLHLKDDSDGEINKIIDEMLNMSDETYLKKVNSQIFKNGNNDNFIESIVNDIKYCINT